MTWSGQSIESLLAAEPLDLQRCNRDDLPIGVSKAFADRMRLDARGCPAALEMRMNYRNLVKEIILHKGHIVSHQFGLMKPRHRLQKDSLKWHLPEGVMDMDMELYNKVLLRRNEDRKTKEEKQKQHEMEALEILEAALQMKELDSLKESAHLLRETTATESLQNHRLAKQTQRPPEAKKRRVAVKSLFLDSAGNPIPLAELPQVEALEDSEYLLGIYDAYEESDASGARDPGVPRTKLPRVLDAMGFKDVDQTTISEILALLPPSSSEEILGLTEFCCVVAVHQELQSRDLQQRFRQGADMEGGAKMSRRRFRNLLRTLGYTLTDTTVKSIIVEHDRSAPAALDLKCFEACLTTVYARAGFTAKQADAFLKVYDKYVLSDRSGIFLRAEALVSFFNYVGKQTAMHDVARYIESFHQSDEGEIRRPEILAVLRGRLEEEYADALGRFSEHDRDKDGILSVEELQAMLPHIGLFVEPEVVDEAIAALLHEANRVDFEDVVEIIERIWSTEGFTQAEKADLQSIFKLFVTRDSHTMLDFELVQAVRWLGYPFVKARPLWNKVDIDRSGTIDFQEFMKLIRAIREEEAWHCKKLFQSRTARSTAGGFPKFSLRQSKMIKMDILQDLVKKLGYRVSIETIQAARRWQVKESNEDKSLDENRMSLQNMISIFRFVREEAILSTRQSAGLPERVVHEIRHRLESHISAAQTELSRRTLAEGLARVLACNLVRRAEHSQRDRNHMVEIIIKEFDSKSVDHHIGLADICQAGAKCAAVFELEAWHRIVQLKETSNFRNVEIAQLHDSFDSKDIDGAGYICETDMKSLLEQEVEMSDYLQDVLEGLLADRGKDRAHADFAEFLRILTALREADTCLNESIKIDWQKVLIVKDSSEKLR